jgi:ArsR family transcriptional regulator
LAIIDFAPHNLEFLREQHAHVRLGFASAEIACWLGECGIVSGTCHELRAGTAEENVLTVAIWTGERPKTAAKQWRAAS